MGAQPRFLASLSSKKPPPIDEAGTFGASSIKCVIGAEFEALLTANL